MNDSSDEEKIDAINYKGIYYGNNDEETKKHDPITGAHFIVSDLRNRLEKILKERSLV